MSRQYGWWQAIRVLSGQDAGNNDLVGITETPGPEIAPPKLIDLLARGCAVVYGVPFNGQLPEQIPAAAWPHVAIQLRSQPPFAIGDEQVGIVAVLRAAADSVSKTAGGGWHHLTIDEAELGRLLAIAERLYPQPARPSASDATTPAECMLLNEAAQLIAQTNPQTTADHLLARLRRTHEFGNLTTAQNPAAEAPSASTIELARWCKKRDYDYPPEWLADSTDEQVDETQDTDLSPYISPYEVAAWIAYRSADPTEDLEVAVKQQLLPALQAGRLTAVGREKCRGEQKIIPRERWIRAELTCPPGMGRLWLVDEWHRGPLYDHVMVSRSDALDLWPVSRPIEAPDISIRTGAPGRPSPMYLVEMELDRRIANAITWPSKAACGAELADWLKHNHPGVPRLTGKSIKNRLGRKMPTAQK
jgi:hypothetical protein